MNRDRWIFFLVLIVASYMILDGVRALAVGNYLTPSTGEYAGQLGPWATVVSMAGIDPRSTLMKLTFVSYGILTSAMSVCFIRKLRWAKTGLLTMSLLGLWYLPFGAIINLVVIVLLMTKND